MSIILGIILLVPLGIYGPRLGWRWLGGDIGLALGVLAALIIGFGVVYALAFGIAAVTGADPVLEVEKGFNAWKILIFVAPASAIYIRRQARAAAAEEEAAEDASRHAVDADRRDGDA